MATLRELIIKVSANSQSFQTEIARASRMGADYYKTMQNGGRHAAASVRETRRSVAELTDQMESAKATALGLTGAFAGAFATGHLISLADEWNSVNARLKQASQSTDDFTSSQKQLMDISQKTGTSFSDNANLFSRSAASMREYGYSSSQVLDITEAISTGLKLSGANAQESSSVITQFSQALAQGVLRGEEFNAVNESGDRVIRALAAGMGVARKDLKSMADQGQLTIDKVVPALISQLGKLRNEYGELPQTVSSSATKVENAFMQWVGGANEASGATNTLTGLLDGPSATVQRVVNGVVDSTWSGFMTRTVVDFSASGINDNETWLGPFLACPQNEVVDAFEVNFAFPNGICGFQNNGNKRVRHVEYEIQYRVYGSGSGWTSKPGVYALKNINGLGFTERFDLSSPGLVEVRCRRRNEQGSNNARDSMFWQALRGRLLSRPTSYAEISTIGITVETGGQLAAQSDKRVSVVATRNYDGGGDRTISGAFLHLARSLGYRDDQIDITALSTLEATYWTPRGEYFDHQASSDSTSAKDIFDKIAEAGMGYFLLSDGLLSVGREGVKSWTGIITPQDTVEEMQTSFRVPSEDDFDGVDVKYINPVTWAEETVQCRTPENPFPRKTEAYTIDVAMTADRAWRIGMRRLMKYLHQRRTYTATTSMLGWCHDFGDHIILSDDIPTGKTQSCLIDAMIYDFQEITLHVTEPLDWSYANPRCWIQFQNGRPSSQMLTPQRVDDFTLTVPYNDDLHPDDWIMDDQDIDLPKLLFCDSETGVRHGIVQEVAPSGDSNCQITAPEYKEIFYQYDDATYPGDAA